MSIGLSLSLAMGRGGAAGAVVFASDDFTDTDGALLDAHAPSGGGSWTRHASSTASVNHLISSLGRARNSATGSSWYTHSAAPPSADYTVSCDVVLVTDNAASIPGIIGRASDSATTHYLARYNTQTDKWELYKLVAGAGTLLGDAAATLVPGQVYRLALRMEGSTISLIVDGVSIVSVTDTAITTAGFAGVRGTGAALAATGAHIDNWEARAN